MGNKLKVMIASRSKSALDEIKEIIHGPELEVIRRYISNGHSDPLYGVREMPDLLIFYLSAAADDELRSLGERPADERPATLVVGESDNTTYMRLALRAGVRDFLSSPVDVRELVEAVERMLLESRNNSKDQHGKLVAVVGAKGGSGASFLAANLAHIMTAHSQFRTALVDLDLQYGPLAQLLDLTPKHGLLQVLDIVDELDDVAVDAYMAKHDSGLSLLSPFHDEVLLPSDIPADRFAKLLDLLRDNYARVVVDQPHQIDEKSALVYERADRIILVTQQDLVNLRNAARLRSLLVRELDVSEELIDVVVNRYDKSAAVELGDVCGVLSVDRHQLTLIPNAYRHVAESINVGQPLLESAGNAAITKALLGLEGQLGGKHEIRPGNFLSRALSTMRGG